MSFTIDTLAAKDAADIARLEKICFPTPWTEEQYRRIMTQAAAKVAKGAKDSAPVFGIRAPSGELLAYIALGVYYKAGEMEIFNIAVDPAWRRQGLASRLLSFALHTMARRGVHAAFLEVRVSNTVAQALYRKHDFEERGRRKGYYSDTGEDALVFVW